MQFLHNFTNTLLGEMIEEMEGDELFEGQEGWQVYQSYLTEAE